MRNFKKTNKSLNKFNKVSAAVLLGLIYNVSPVNSAYAAESTAAEKEAEVETIRVTGTRLVSRNVIVQKQNSAQIVDSIGQDEIGGLPVGNAAELLAQVPGLNPFEDLSGRGSGGSSGPEVRFVSIRGIRPDLNITLLDGLTLATSNFENRAVYLDAFPVNLAARTDVIKTFTPEMNPGGVGGQINFITRKGVDLAEPLFTVTAETGVAEIDDAVQGVDDPLRLEALYAGQITENIGIALSGSYNKRDLGKPSQLTRGRSRSIDFPTQEDVRVVREHRILSESAPTTRIGLSAKLDWTPDDDTYLWFTTAYNDLDQTINHNKSDVRIPSSAEGLTLDASGQSGTLRIDDSDVAFGTGRSAFSEVGEFINKADLTLFQAGINKIINDDFTFNAKAGYSEANNSREAEYYLYMRTGGVTDIAFDSSNITEPSLSVISPSPESYFDPSQYNLLYRNMLPEKAKEEVLDAIIDVAYNADIDDEGWGLKTGVQYRTTERSYDFDLTTHYDIANETVEGTGFSLSDVFAENSSDLSPPGSSSGFPAFFADINEINKTVTPSLSDTSIFRFENLDSNRLGADYAIDEKVVSLFVQGVYQSEKIQSILGFRYEKTTTDGSGFREVDGTYEASENSGSYDFILPSLLVNYNIQDDLILRFAASKTLGRPAFPEISPSGELESIGLQNTLTRSNPDLKPRLSTNLDLSLEWYFTSDSMATIGFFSKDIKDEILVETLTDVTIDGVTYDEVTQPVNASKATIKGVELSFVSYLPEPYNSFGISSNAIFMDTTFDTKGERGKVDFLLYQPDSIVNVSLLYTDDNFDASLSLNRTAELPTVFNPSDANGDQYNQARTTLSAKLLYNVSENTKVYINGSNLTSEDSVEMTGEGVLYHNRIMGRTVNLGVTHKF
ncbi:TonB-dependent receptor [Colwellia sp. 6_MG-2023]|uniref:TonB-dependent receptor n=1 Tax=Colwellia sp. 6_MG-2023 TaxID=3062676 RepID=UPI0026E19255|nr:TonB-dependent receptor [Colwellia sp. 6_MG-2023]MDO6488970.1 TonB-dependent receptor [Colwellia sp. 6_MG-2023]